MVNNAVNGEPYGESCDENEHIPNPTPTTRFFRCLVVNSNTKIYITIIFRPILKILVVNLVVMIMDMNEYDDEQYEKEEDEKLKLGGGRHVVIYN